MRAAVQLDQAPRERQADAKSAAGAVERMVDLHEHVEDARELGRLDADARIA